MAKPKRDIDEIVERVVAANKGISVSQMRKIHDADDDGIWWFGVSDPYEIQVESSSGQCPFLVEMDIPGLPKRQEIETVDEVVQLVCRFA